MGEAKVIPSVSRKNLNQDHPSKKWFPGQILIKLLSHQTLAKFIMYFHSRDITLLVMPRTKVLT